MGKRTSLKPRHTMLARERTNGQRMLPARTLTRGSELAGGASVQNCANKTQFGTFTSKTRRRQCKRSCMHCRRTLIADQTGNSTELTAPHRSSQNKRPLETSLRSVAKAHHHTTCSMYRPQTQLLQRVRPNTLQNACERRHRQPTVRPHAQIDQPCPNG